VEVGHGLGMQLMFFDKTVRRLMMKVLFAVVIFLLWGDIATRATAASGDQQTPGTTIHIDINALPLPSPQAVPTIAFPKTIKRPENVSPTVPSGFKVVLFAEGLSHARNMLVAANGDVFVAEPRASKVTLLRDNDGDGRAEVMATFIDNLNRPHGLAFTDGFILIGAMDGLWKIPYVPGDLKAQGRGVNLVPNGTMGPPDMRFHWHRNIAVHPDGDRVFVGIGSLTNADDDPKPHATIQEVQINGSGVRQYASGIRVPSGLAFYPGTDDLYTVANERDLLGDELVPDYLTIVEEGGFYGWPYSYWGANLDPRLEGKGRELAARAIVPDTPFRSHSAPTGLVIYSSDSFPPEWRNGAFVSLHGSWNAATPRGYHVVYVPFENGRPKDSYVVFASGFWLDSETRLPVWERLAFWRDKAKQAQVWGRPGGLAVDNDGNLLMSDDVSQTVWRVMHTGE